MGFKSCLIDYSGVSGAWQSPTSESQLPRLVSGSRNTLSCDPQIGNKSLTETDEMLSFQQRAMPM